MHQTRNSSTVFANYPEDWIVPLGRPIPASEATCLDTSGFVSVSLPSVSTLHCQTHSIAYLKQCKLNTKSLNTVCACVKELTRYLPGDEHSVFKQPDVPLTVREQQQRDRGENCQRTKRKIRSQTQVQNNNDLSGFHDLLHLLVCLFVGLVACRATNPTAEGVLTLEHSRVQLSGSAAQKGGVSANAEQSGFQLFPPPFLHFLLHNTCSPLPFESPPAPLPLLHTKASRIKTSPPPPCSGRTKTLCWDKRRSHAGLRQTPRFHERSMRRAQDATLSYTRLGT